MAIEVIEVTAVCDQCDASTSLEIPNPDFFRLEQTIEKMLKQENWHYGDKERDRWQCNGCWDEWQAELEAEEAERNAAEAELEEEDQ